MECGGGEWGEGVECEKGTISNSKSAEMLDRKEAFFLRCSGILCFDDTGTQGSKLK